MQGSVTPSWSRKRSAPGGMRPVASAMRRPRSRARWNPSTRAGSIPAFLSTSVPSRSQTSRSQPMLSVAPPAPARGAPRRHAHEAASPSPPPPGFPPAAGRPPPRWGRRRARAPDPRSRPAAGHPRPAGADADRGASPPLRPARRPAARARSTARGGGPRPPAPSRRREGGRRGGGGGVALQGGGPRLGPRALQPGPELGEPQLDRLVARRGGGGQLVVEGPVGRAGAREREPHAERSRSRNCSAQRVLQKDTERPPASFRMARDRTTYVWHTGSFTSSSRAPPPSTGRGPLIRASALRISGHTVRISTAMAARTRSPRICSAAGFGADRERAEEVAVLFGEIEGVAAVGLPCAREEDAGFRPAPENLLHRLARGLGGSQGHLDGLEQLGHQRVVRLGRHGLNSIT